MSQAKHTPGPWHAKELSEPMGIEISNAATGAHVCYVRDLFGDVDDVQRVNARLIAAAPDLLAELQSFVDRWGKYPKPPTGDDLKIYLDNARAAVARATGA